MVDLDNTTGHRWYSGRLRRVFTRYAAVSFGATAISQVVLVWLYANGTGAAAASTVAFLVGAAPHFVITRWWAWDRRDTSRLRVELAAYVLVTMAGGLLSILMTTGTEWLLDPLVSDRATLGLLLNVAYLVSGAPVFVLKFAVLDRVFAPTRPHRRGHGQPQPADA